MPFLLIYIKTPSLLRLLKKKEEPRNSTEAQGNEKKQTLFHKQEISSFLSSKIQHLLSCQTTQKHIIIKELQELGTTQKFQLPYTTWSINKML